MTSGIFRHTSKMKRFAITVNYFLLKGFFYRVLNTPLLELVLGKIPTLHNDTDRMVL